MFVCLFISTILFVNIFGNDDKPKNLDYKIEQLENKEKAVFNINRFYPIHYFYMNIFLSLNLYDSFSYDQKKDIIQRIIYNITNNNKVVVTVYNYIDNKDLTITVLPNTSTKKSGWNKFYFVQ